MTADVAVFSQLESFRNGPRSSMGSSFSYSSQPRPLYYDSYRNLTDSAKPIHGNIMYDKRVIRGNTWALRRMATEALAKTSAEERMQMQERRRQIRQRVQSKLKNDQQLRLSAMGMETGRRRKLDSLANSVPLSAGSSASGFSGKKRRQLSGLQPSPPFEDTPPITTRRSSTILEEEPILDDKPNVYSSSGDSGINMRDASTPRSQAIDRGNFLDPPEIHIQADTPIGSEKIEDTDIADQKFEIDQSDLNGDAGDQVQESGAKSVITGDQSNQPNQEPEPDPALVESIIEDYRKNVGSIFGEPKTITILLDVNGQKVEVQAQQLPDGSVIIDDDVAAAALKQASTKSESILDNISSNGKIEESEILQEITDMKTQSEITLVKDIDDAEQTMIEDRSTQDLDQVINRLADLRDQSTALIQTFLSISMSHIISISDHSQKPLAQSKPSTSFIHHDFHRGPIMSPIDEHSMFNPVLSSSAQSMVSNLLENSVRNIDELASNAATGDNDTVSDLLIDGDQVITDEIDTDQVIRSGNRADIRAFEALQLQTSNEGELLMMYCQYMVDQLIDTAVGRMQSLSGDQLIDNPDQTIHMASEELVENLLESSVQHVIKLTISESINDLNVEDRLIKTAWVSEEAIAEWHQQLKEMEEEVLMFGYKDPKKQGQIDEEQSTSRRKSILKSRKSFVLDTKIDSVDFGIDLVTKVDKLANLLGEIDFDNLPIDANLIRNINEELQSLKRRAEMEELQKVQLIDSYKMAIEEGNKYVCRSIAQEYVASLLNSPYQLEAHIPEEQENKEQKFTSQHVNVEIQDSAEANFKQETAIFAFEDVTNNNGETDSFADFQKKVAKQIVNDVKKDLEPWIYGRAYADVAREMTNLWLQDATGGRSQYCRCSAQRPLRRLLHEVEEMENHFP